MTRAGRLHTGVRNLDDVCDGGLVRGSLLAISGPPGSGKTILAQQICFHNAALSLSVFLHKIAGPQPYREKLYTW